MFMRFPLAVWLGFSLVGLAAGGLIDCLAAGPIPVVRKMIMAGTQKTPTQTNSKNQVDDAKVTDDAKATADPAVSKALIFVTMLAVIDIRPSGVNPNVMSEEQFAAFVKEVKATGRIPKPIVVVKTKTGYKIVDGEHACRAAKEAGLTHVSCEIIEADAFEIMRQTVTRNRHGDNNAVLLGQLYSKMLKVGKLSNRELAKKLDLTEGSVRNYLAYGEAFQLRNGYASSGALELISGKTIKQVETYLKLPAAKRDDWLDSGGRLEEAAKLMPAKPSAEKATESSKAPAAESPEPDDKDGNDAANAENATPKDKNATPDNDSDAESSPDEGEDAEAGDDDGDADEDGDARRRTG